MTHILYVFILKLFVYSREVLFALLLEYHSSLSLFCCRFMLLEDYLIEFNQLALAHAEGSDGMLNRVMLKDNIGIAALLEVKDSTTLHMPSQYVLVANAHIHWDPEFADVKLIPDARAHKRTQQHRHEGPDGTQDRFQDTHLGCRVSL